MKQISTSWLSCNKTVEMSWKFSCSAAVKVAALFKCSDSLSVFCFSAAITLMVAWFSISCHALSNSHSFELDKNLCSASAIVSLAASWIPATTVTHRKKQPRKIKTLWEMQRQPNKHQYRRKTGCVCYASFPQVNKFVVNDLPLTASAIDETRAWTDSVPNVLDIFFLLGSFHYGSNQRQRILGRNLR